MKKTLSILLSAVISLGCACALAACSKPKEQANNMVIKSVWQDASGSVNVTVDVKNVEFTDSNGDDRYYNVQPSIDGGQNWYNCSVSLDKSSVSGGEATFILLNRNYYEGDYYFFGNYSDDNKVSLSTGDKLNISLRFAANSSYLVSDKTESVEYTIKSYTHLEMDNSSCEGVLIISGGATRYAFQRGQGDSFKFIQLFVLDDEQSTNEAREVPADVLSLVEYKFLTKADLEEGEAGMIYLSSTLRATEDSTETSGWNDYDAQNGITQEDYKDHIIHNVYTGNWTTGDGVVTGTYKNEYDEVYLIVRLKASGSALKSEIKLVTLIINRDEKDYDLEGNLVVD